MRHLWTCSKKGCGHKNGFWTSKAKYINDRTWKSVSYTSKCFLYSIQYICNYIEWFIDTGFAPMLDSDRAKSPRDLWLSAGPGPRTCSKGRDSENRSLWNPHQHPQRQWLCEWHKWTNHKDATQFVYARHRNWLETSCANTMGTKSPITLRHILWIRDIAKTFLATAVFLLYLDCRRCCQSINTQNI